MVLVLTVCNWLDKRLRFCTPHLSIKCRKGNICISAVLWQNPMKHVSNSFYLIVTHGESFSLAPPPPPPFNTLKHFPTFHYRSSSVCVFPIFSLLQRSKLPLKDTQGFNKPWKAFSHICPLQTNKITLLSFQYPTTFFVLYATSIPHHPPPISKISPRDTWNQSLITNLFSFNPLQYKSNHCKQNLLISTRKISHCLLQLQLTKSKEFHLGSAWTSSTESPICMYVFFSLSLENQNIKIYIIY